MEVIRASEVLLGGEWEVLSVMTSDLCMIHVSCLRQCRDFDGMGWVYQYTSGFDIDAQRMR
jgi:hypothetical protein